MRCVRGSGGFTLIEILVVLIVISVLVSLVAINVAPNNRERNHERYLPEIRNFVVEGYATARLQRRDFGLHFSRDRIHLYALTMMTNDAGDPSVELEAVAVWSVPETLELRLAIADERRLLPAYNEQPPAMDDLHVLVLPDGTGDSPWALELTWAEDGDIWQRLVSDGFNPPQWRFADEF